MTYGSYETLEVSKKDAVLEVRLNRPEARNAMNSQMLSEWDSVLDAAQVDDDIRVVTLFGNGSVFSAGHDLKEVADWFTTPGGMERMGINGIPQLERSWYFTKPLIAGVHGYVGPHTILLLTSFDFIIASDDARFSFEQTRVSAGMPHSILPLQIPMRAYLKLAMMGGWFDAETARGWDFVQRVTPRDGLEDEVNRWAAEAAKVPPGSIQALKEVVHGHYEDLGLLNLIRKVRPGGHGTAQDIEYFKAIIDGGLRAALTERDAVFDNEVAQI